MLDIFDNVLLVIEDFLDRVVTVEDFVDVVLVVSGSVERLTIVSILEVMVDMTGIDVEFIMLWPEDVVITGVLDVLEVDDCVRVVDILDRMGLEIEPELGISGISGISGWFG